MSSFKGHEFRVVPRQGLWPLVERDRDGVPTYNADIRVESKTAYQALQDLACIADARMAGGVFLGKVIVQRQTNPDVDPEGDLTVPLRHGEAGTFTSILVDFRPETSGVIANRFDVRAVWIITDPDITP